MNGKVLLLDRIGPEARPILEEAGFTVTETGKGFGKDADVLGRYLADNFPAGDLQAVCLRSGTTLAAEAMPLLRRAGAELAVRFGTGTDNIDLPAACQAGILVENTPGCNSKSVAELTLGCALALSRKTSASIGSLAAIRAILDFRQAAVARLGAELAPILAELETGLVKRFAVSKKDCAGSELGGKTIGIIGCCGNIGAKVATRAMALGMQAIGFDKRRGQEIEGLARVSLAELLARADVITAHVWLDDQTRGLIGAEQIAQMKPGVLLLNLARQGIVDIGAVLADMTSGKPIVGGYASDVDDPNHPLFAAANTICLPHIGASTAEAEARCAVMGAEQVVAWLRESELTHGVNFPDLTDQDQRQDGCLVVIHRDEPGLIERLAHCFGERNINIGPFQTVPGEAGFACSVIGPDEPVSADVVGELSAIAGVIRVILH